MFGRQRKETAHSKVSVTTAMKRVVLIGNDLPYAPSKLAQFENMFLVVLPNTNIKSVKALASSQTNSIDLSNKSQPVYVNY